MLQRSTNAGLCSRLNQRERLRAASSPPVAGKAKKAKMVQDQPKPFEFALMNLDPDEEEMAINSENVALRGFVNLVNNDGESQIMIRSKIGEAIRLKYPLVGNSDFVFFRANRRKLSTPVSCEEYNYKQVKLLCGQGAIYIKMKEGFECLFDGDEKNSHSDDDLPDMFNQPAPQGTEAQLFTCDKASGGLESNQPAHQGTEAQLFCCEEASEGEEETSEEKTEESLESVAEHCVNYCKAKGIENPVEILRYAQSLIVTRRPLDVQDLNVSLEGKTNFLVVNPAELLKTAMEEVKFIIDPRITLQIGFHGDIYIYVS